MKSVFEELLDVAGKKKEPQRLLFLFVRAEEKKPGKNRKNRRGELHPVMAVDKLPAELGNFRFLVREADRVCKEWDMVLVASLGLESAEVPTSADAEPFLDRMTRDVEESKDLSGYVIFDRKGKLVEVLTN